jgi:hypothetical protein
MLARELLQQAIQLYDNPDVSLADQAQNQGWKQGFTSGAEWMRLAMSNYRETQIPANHSNYQYYGTLKYGLASLGALAVIGFVIGLKVWILLPLVVIVFYAIEAQMVFLFPLLIDGHSDAIQQSLQWTSRAGGTIPVMLTVLQLACVMLFGGFVGQGFVRSWALGCLSIVIWYEELRHVDNRIN